MPVEKSAGAIVFYIEPDGEVKYLFLKHKPTSWDFPKGLIEKGESLEDAALRECREETGLQDIELVPGFKETIRFFFKVKYKYLLKRGLKMGEIVLKFVTYFLVQSKTKDVRVSFEHDDYEWVNFEKAMEILKRRKENKELLLRANAFIIQRKGV